MPALPFQERPDSLSDHPIVSIEPINLLVVEQFVFDKLGFEGHETDGPEAEQRAVVLLVLVLQILLLNDSKHRFQPDSKLSGLIVSGLVGEKLAYSKRVLLLGITPHLT